MRNYIFVLLGVIIGLCASCDSMLDNIQPYLDKGEVIYVGKVDSLEAFPGKNRVKIKGLYLYGVTQKKCVITWLSMDEEEMAIEQDVVRENPEDTFEVIIDNLDEGQYEFTITTYDAKGNSSIKSIVDSYVYGALYESNLVNRKIDSWNINGASMEINWRPVNDALEVELYYINRDGLEVKRVIPIAETRTVVNDCAYEGSIRWRTVYLPEEKAIDRFYSEETVEEYSFYDERELDKSKFAEVKLDGDFAVDAWGRSMSLMWDGNHTYDDDWTINHGDGFENFPVWFTFDLGVVANLTRYTFWQRNIEPNEAKDYSYDGSNFKKWEVWGRADKPSQDGSWDGWIKLADCEIKKPSGSELGILTDEDIQAAKDGHAFEFSTELPAVRYIRFKLLETFDGTKNCYVKEVTFYGVEQYY